MADDRKHAQNRSSVRKPTLSPTRISIYLDCIVKYRYLYIDKIGKYYQRSHSYYSFGSTLHHVLQDFHEQEGRLTSEQLVEQLATKWIAAGYESEEQERTHRQAGEQIVQAYQTAHQERVAAKTETIATEKSISWDMGRFKLTGRVDRIDRHADESLEIIDYKSGRLDVTTEEVANDLAMRCYQFILKRLHPESRVISTIYCLRSGVSASVELEPEELDVFGQYLTVLGDQILDSDYDAPVPVPLPICPTCDFLPRCTSFWRMQERQERLDDSLSDMGL